MTHFFDRQSMKCLRCGCAQSDVFDSEQPLECWEVTFFLDRCLPSGQHTMAVAAISPVDALTKMMDAYPRAIPPFTVGYATGQGEGHRP